MLTFFLFGGTACLLIFILFLWLTNDLLEVFCFPYFFISLFSYKQDKRFLKNMTECSGMNKQTKEVQGYCSDQVCLNSPVFLEIYPPLSFLYFAKIVLDHCARYLSCPLSFYYEAWKPININVLLFCRGWESLPLGADEETRTPVCEHTVHSAGTQGYPRELQARELWHWCRNSSSAHTSAAVLLPESPVTSLLRVVWCPTGVLCAPGGWPRLRQRVGTGTPAPHQ